MSRYSALVLSILRFDVDAQGEAGTIRSAISYGPCSLEPHHPDLFWYGVHPTEAPPSWASGVKLIRVTTESTDVVTGIWNDGRVGVFHGLGTVDAFHTK